MENLNLDINLLKLSRVGVATIHGVKCVVIPCKENDIFVSQDQQAGKAKGAYLHLTAWANKNGASQYGNTHMLKQSFSKEFRDTHPNANQQSPIIGNGKPIQVQGSNINQVNAPNVNVEDDNLPF